MALQGTICRLCGRQISANGLSAAKNEVKAHLLTEHKEEYLEFEALVRQYQDSIVRARDIVLAKADEMVLDAQLITPANML